MKENNVKKVKNLEKKWKISEFEIIEVAELENFEKILQRLDNGEGPFQIYDPQSEARFIIIGWEDFWERCEWCYPSGERERVEAALHKVESTFYIEQKTERCEGEGTT